MSLERRVGILTTSALFREVPKYAVAALAEHSVTRRVRQGQILFTANEPAGGLYIVLSGSVRVFQENVEGREQTLNVERPGDTLAEVAVFDGGPYPSSAIAEEDSEVLFLTTEDVRKFMLRHPQAALSALAITAKKLRTFASLAEQLAFKNANQRLAILLLEEARRVAPKLQNGIYFSLPLSHKQLAWRLGSVRETVTRGLQKLVQERVIEVRRHRILVLNIRALQEQAGNHRHWKATPVSKIRAAP